MDRMVLIASPNHELNAREEASLRDLDGLPLVVHHLCSSTSEVVQRLFRQNGIRCNIVAELWSFESIKEFVSMNVGVAIVPRITVAQELRANKLVEICLPQLNIPRSTHVIFRRDYISETANRLIEIMLEKRDTSPQLAELCNGPRSLPVCLPLAGEFSAPKLTAVASGS